MNKLILIILCLIVIIGVYKKESEVRIPNSAIRFRVLANSNSKEDQEIKEEVRDNMQRKLYDLLKDTTDISAARNLITNEMVNFESIVDSSLKNANYSYTIDYGMHDFPEKTYKGVTYEAGSYESLLVTLGEGKGNNWWCVLFPPMCLLEAEENTNTDEVEYKSYIKELIEKYF